MNVRPKCSFGRGKTLTGADRSVFVDVQELFPGKQDGKCSCLRLPASNSAAFHGCAVLLHE